MRYDPEDLILETSKILEYGFQKMITVNLDRRNIRKKPLIVYLSMCAVQSYTGAILKLVSPPNIYDLAAEVIFRSIVECYINLNYIYASRSELNALMFLIHSHKDRITYARKYKKFMLKYPQWKYAFGQISTPEDWDSFIQGRKKLIEQAEKQFRKDISNQTPNIEQRAAIVDQNLKTMGVLTQDNSAEFYYVQYYNYFSQPAHLNIDGLERFYRYNKNGNKSLMIDGIDKDSQRLLSITYQLYFVILRHFLIVFKVYDRKEFEHYNLYSKNMAKSL